MNSTELAAALAQQADMPEYKARQAVRIVTGQVKDTLSAGGSVSLPGLGRFVVSVRAARSYPHPKDKTKIVHSPERMMVGFKPVNGLFDNPPSWVEDKPGP